MIDRWVMVSYDNYTWSPRKLLADLGESKGHRYICDDENSSVRWNSWSHMHPATAEELLPMLPDGWRELAVKRCKEFPNLPNRKADTLHDALLYAIGWIKTPEGYRKWNYLYGALRYGTTLPPVPVPQEEPKPDLRSEQQRLWEEEEDIEWRTDEHDEWTSTVRLEKRCKWFRLLADEPRAEVRKKQPEPKPRTIRIPVSRCCNAQVENMSDGWLCYKCDDTGVLIDWVTVQAVAGEEGE